MIAYKTHKHTHLSDDRLPIYYCYSLCLPYNIANAFISMGNITVFLLLNIRFENAFARAHTHIIFSSYRIKIAKCRNGFCCFLPRCFVPGVVRCCLWALMKIYSAARWVHYFCIPLTFSNYICRSTYEIRARTSPRPLLCQMQCLGIGIFAGRICTDSVCNFHGVLLAFCDCWSGILWCVNTMNIIQTQD